ncbi:MAG: hypothetical protein COW65_01790 [Cytophagales bacterium CG18_big_fil_WC_8_21_14_2_50_42_9]|nr:MAG: hypothetical protein COW65_01790 [Cytophagales bacterium CG18_big_fil_WC_8_21_14_2_50_42_9]
MKKLVAMFALGLSIVGTSYAQNAPQRERSETQDSRYGQEHKERNDKDNFGRDDDRQNKLTAEQRAIQRTERLSQQLDLSSKQKKKLQELNLKQARQMESLASRNNSGQRNNNQRREMQQLRSSWEKEFKSIVSKKQYAKYEEDRKQMQAQRANRSNRQGENNTHFRRSANS